MSTANLANHASAGGQTSTPFFSVVIPVYNIQEYVDECVSSILAQTLQDIEIILVDDGSTDSSPAICDSFAMQDERIRAIHQDNSGLSSARNAGIRASSGKYLLFVDGDDYYDALDFLDELRAHVLNHDLPDMTIFGSSSYWMDRQCIEEDGSQLCEALNEMDLLDALNTLVLSDSLLITAWSRAIKRSFLLQNELFFEKGLFSEDVEWSLRTYDKCSHMTVMDSRPYMYRKGRPGSITKGVGSKNIDDGIRILEKFANEYEYSSADMREVILGYCAYQLAVFCGLLSRFPRSETRNQHARLRAMSWLFRYGNSPKTAMVKRLNRILGYQATASLLSYYIRLRRS